MLKCKECGREFADGELFCSEDGSRLIKPIFTFTDPRDGQVYRTVKIGNQIWMAQNLNYDIKSFFGSKSRCYGDNPEYAERYGRLYNWETAKKAVPLGWHLPSAEEWQTLVDFVGGDEIAGTKLKATNGWSFNDWDKISGNGTDDYGFSALPGGCFYSDSEDGFWNIGQIGYWWSSMSDGAGGVWRRAILHDFSSVSWGRDDVKKNLFSIRCLKD
ncbi:MAG: fibrobacter succinogenes major paralogous domain-containing protein [Fibromonadales bacterium]|nr:fibrobacter succinogenes major paralogous domain-containing protein [Fibromonadales bacterium]